MGGALPPALLCAALGLALAFAPFRARIASFAVLVAVAVVVSFVPVGPTWAKGIFLGCWATIVLTAAAVHLPRGVSSTLAVLLAANAGLWTGGVIAAAGSFSDLAKALPLALLCIPGAWLEASGRAIAVKVVASWMVAVAILAGSLSLNPITPGYQPDHME